MTCIFYALPPASLHFPHSLVINPGTVLRHLIKSCCSKSPSPAFLKHQGTESYKVFYWVWNILGKQGITNTQQKYPSPKPQAPLCFAGIALPPTAGIYPSITAKIFRSLKKDSKDAPRIFSLISSFVRPYEHQIFSQSPGFVCAAVLLHFQTMVFEFSP